MLINVAVIVLLALALGQLFNFIGLPALLAMIILGSILGPNGIDFIDYKLLGISEELRLVALIIILIRAGLGINSSTLKRIGLPALRMSFIPCLLEAVSIIGGALFLIKEFTLIDAGILAFILSAVSPAVIVPQMLDLKEGGWGKKNEVPTLVLAGASVDDVFAITFFSAFIAMSKSSSANIGRLLLHIPIGIASGVLLGILVGLLLVWFFKKFHIRDTKKMIVLMVAAIALNSLEKSNLIPLASLLGVMAIGFIIVEKNSSLALRMASKFNKLWIPAELMLFVMIGAAVNVKAIGGAGIIGVLIIFIGLFGRSIGVLLSLIHSPLNMRERFFCVIAYVPKATVQAAIGAIPLELGLPHGELILAIAVLSIVITAPLGAIGIRLTAKHLLKKQ